jgi:hypothetical protein
VLKLEPGCGVTAILLEPPANGQRVHAVQSPAAGRHAADPWPQRRHSGPAHVSALNQGDLAAAEDGQVDRPAGQPGSTVPDAVGNQLTEQEHRRLTRRVLQAQHRQQPARAAARGNRRPGRPAPVRSTLHSARTVKPAAGPGARHCSPGRHLSATS